MEKYLTIKETAAMTATAYATVKRDIDNGKLPAYKVGRKYFISNTDAHIYAAARKEIAETEGYTIRQFMDILPLSYAFVIEEIKSGRLPAKKCGRRFIIPKADMEKYLEEAKIL